jgi:hypothetical protein
MWRVLLELQAMGNAHLEVILVFRRQRIPGANGGSRDDAKTKFPAFIELTSN